MTQPQRSIPRAARPSRPVSRTALGLALAAALGLSAAPAARADTTVYIDSKLNGSYVAGGVQTTPPGSTAYPYNPVQITLGPGTYQVTNAATSGYFSGWNYNTGGNNWIWQFNMAEHGGAIILDDYVGSGWTAAATTTQAAMAALTGVATSNGNTLLSGTSTAGFVDTFTLTQTTTLDFYVNDYYWGLGDNDGGVALNITAVPEPAAAWLWAAGGAVLLGRRWRRRS